MSVINTFFGAIVGIWMMSVFGKIITEKWLSFLPLLILFLLISNFSIFTEKPKGSGGKLPRPSFIFILFVSFWVSILIQIAADPKIPWVEFLSLPKTWLLSLIIIFWAFTLDHL